MSMLNLKLAFVCNGLIGVFLFLDFALGFFNGLGFFRVRINHGAMFVGAYHGGLISVAIIV
jgi:hypothetical protein